MAKDWVKNQIKRRQHAVQKKKTFKGEFQLSKEITKTTPSSSQKVKVNEKELVKLVEGEKDIAVVDQQTHTQTEVTEKKVVPGQNWKRLEQVLKNKFRNRPKQEREEKKEKYEPIPLSFSGDLTPLPGPTSNNMDITDTLAIDCEMVGVGKNGHESVLGSVCIVNAHGNIIYRRTVKPLEPVTDYRTAWSGLRPEDIENGVPIKQVQYEVACIVQNRVLVGHELKHDFHVLLLSHPQYLIRDTAHWAPLKQGKQPQSLKHLAKKILGAAIQVGEHNPQEDAWTAFLVYKKYKDRWEESLPRPLKKKFNDFKMTKAWKRKKSKLEQVLKIKPSPSGSSVKIGRDLSNSDSGESSDSEIEEDETSEIEEDTSE
eukprot:TRINITY_DN3703_c0_g2_i3.p1 TRINITY_DN3703_c0_g2~~TRINITY_DN3703_c0_g2_i3.p1  ORF type:complete len:400 (+),score=109.38 TRINITY_DN3703_c0_g2_i3:89-1201(+)